MTTCRTKAAEPSDIDAIIEMGRAMHTESVYSVLRFSEEKVRHLVLTAIEYDWFLQIAERNGKPVGMMAAYCAPHWCSDDLMVSDLLLYVLPEHRGGFAAVLLVEDFKAWVVATGAKLVTVGTTAIPDHREAVVDFYQARGFSLLGAVMRLNHV